MRNKIHNKKFLRSFQCNKKCFICEGAEWTVSELPHLLLTTNFKKQFFVTYIPGVYN